MRIRVIKGITKDHLDEQIGPAPRNHFQVEVRFTERLVVGENIAQTLQFAASGNAAAALVAVAQLQLDQLPEDGCSWRIPADLHAPIEQQAVVLARAADNKAARAFFEFLQSDEARELIERSGYAVQDQ